MRQLTLRISDPELERAIAQLAEREAISLNRAALRLLQAGAGLGDERAREPGIGAGLDRFFGTMSADEADEVDEAVQALSTIDEQLWL